MNKTITTTELTCCLCGTTYAMDEVLVELRRNDGLSFFCPNGHSQCFGASPASKLKTKVAELTEALDELRDAKIEITRLRCELVNAQKKNFIQRILGTK